jgi:hypothetical protein
MSDALTVKVGGRDYEIVAQGIGRIRRKLVKLMQLGSGEAEVDDLSPQIYDLLKTFIPDLDPVYRLLGYSSQEEYDAGADPDGSIPEATLPQVLDAIDAVYRANGADRLVRLGKSLLGGEGLQMLLRREVLTIFSERSLSSPSEKDGAASTPSTTTPPTSELSEVPPSPDFSPSATPASAAA